MYSFGDARTVDGEPGAVWAVWSDPHRFPEWDPREERTRLDGPFAVGSSVDSKQRGNPGGVATITAVEPGVNWTVESPLPGGRLTIDHRVEPAGPGRVRVSKSYEVTGPLTVLFRSWYGPRVIRSLPASFEALGAEARRRASGSGVR
jgi:polyketide cyclase/dehydrase/lipid transport protein